MKDYDYSRYGAYFVTICTQKRLLFFGDIVYGEMLLNEAGEMIKRIWFELPEKYPGIQLDSFTVMPNHVHGILFLVDESPVGAAPSGRPLTATDNPEDCLANRFASQNEGQPLGVAPTDMKRLSLPDIVHRFKSFTTNLYSRGVRRKGWGAFPERLWQRNYYERIIRDDIELSALREYTENNPLNWDKDEENPNNTGNSQPPHAIEPSKQHRYRLP